MNRSAEKVILVGPYHKYGGVSRYVKDLLASSSNFILFDTARPEKRKIRPGTGYVEAFNTGLARVLGGILVTIRNLLVFPLFVMRSGADIVHVCGVSFFPFWENAIYILSSKLLGMRVTLHYLGAFDQFYDAAGSLQKFLIRLVMRVPDRIMLLSEKVMRLTATFIDEERLEVLPSSVDTDRFHVKDREFPAVQGQFRILFVGGLDPFRKGVYDLLAAFRQILPMFPESILVMTGGDSFKEVRERWKEMDLEDSIEFRGWVEETHLPQLYASSDVLVLPSYNEGLPYVIIEALSSGLPLITSKVGGMPEVVEDGKNGFLIDAGDVEALSSALRSVVGDRESCIRFSKSNREKAVGNYSVRNVISKLRSTFTQLSGSA